MLTVSWSRLDRENHAHDAERNPRVTDGLVRAIGIGRATAMVAGTIIGASIFVQPSLVSAAVPTTGGVLLVWTAAGALTLIGALITAELSSAFPRTGGVYVFLREAYGPATAYLWGWAMFWSMHSGIIAAIATVFARYLAHFVPLGETGTRAAAVGAIVVLSAVNYVGVRWGSALQTVFTIVKLAAVAAIVVLGVAFLAAHGPAGTGIPGAGESVSASGFTNAMVAGLFAYGGWHMVTYAADETRDAARTIPRALIVGTALVTAVYIAVNAAYLLVLPFGAVVSSQRIAADFAAAVLGTSAGGAISVLVMVSALGGMTGIILAGPRVYLAMAGDGLLFRWIGAVHPVHRTPHVAIVLQAAWASVLVLTGSYRALFTRVVYTEWIFFALMAASLYLFRARPSYAPAYRLRGYRLLSAIFVGSSLAIVAHELMGQPRDAALGLGIVLAGLPVYWGWKRIQTSDSRPTT